MKTTSKYFSTQKKKISVLLIFSNSQISNNSRSEPSDVTGFPFSRRSIWRPKLTSLQCWTRGNTKPPSQACVCLSTTTTSPDAGTFQARCGSFRNLDRQTKWINIYDLTVDPCFWLANHNDWSRWFAISSSHVFTVLVSVLWVGLQKIN
jgi:hypothetical protein